MSSLEETTRKMFRVRESEAKAAGQPPVAKLEGGSTGFIWQ